MTRQILSETVASIAKVVNETTMRTNRRCFSISMFLLALLLPGSWAQAQDGALPNAPQYLGHIKRNANGELIVVPFSQDPEGANPAPPDGKGVLAISGPRLIKVGFSQDVHTPSAAATIAKDGDTVEIEAGVYVADTAVWTQKNLTIRGIEGRPQLLAGGASAEGKAIWVVRGGDITIENIEFRNASARDRNAAGIRFEKGNLRVRNCRFLRNQNGILTADGDLNLRIESSEFGYNGSGDGYSHSLYAGQIKSLYVTGSYFHHAKAGHLLKSRAQENHILFNRLTDETGGRASYEIDLPNGGQDYIIGNLIEKSATAENPNLISFGVEGFRSPDSRLYLVNNTLLNDRSRGGNLLIAKDGYAKIAVVNNVLIGKFNDASVYVQPGLSVDSAASNVRTDYRNNITADRADVVDAAQYDLRPVIGRKLTPDKIGSTLIDGADLTPQSEYLHPAQLEPVVYAGYPGAVQKGVAQ